MLVANLLTFDNIYKHFPLCINKEKCIILYTSKQLNFLNILKIITVIIDYEKFSTSFLRPSDSNKKEWYNLIEIITCENLSVIEYYD